MFFILSQVWDKEIKIKNSIKYNSIQYFIQEIQIIITTEIPLEMEIVRLSLYVTIPILNKKCK